ncbi:hypothetical protein [Geodermatophilus sp. SYSU D00815]
MSDLSSRQPLRFKLGERGKVAELGTVRARHEVDRLTGLAAEMGYVRAPGQPARRGAPLSTEREIDRYGELAGELGLSGTRSNDRSFPSLGR